jgi:hypothetical protein
LTALLFALTLVLLQLQIQSGHVSVIFSEEELEAALKQAGPKLTVLFSGLTWCRPCKGMSKPFERMADVYGAKGGVSFLKLFGNANPRCKQMFKNLKIRSTPSFLFYRNGT